MVVQNVVFWILAAGMILAAIGVVRSQNVVHAALYLVVVLGGGAAQYILLAAEFVAWVQVLIYIGAVIILFLFGIMLTRAPMGGDTNLDNDQRWPAAVVSVFLLGVLATLLVDAFSDQKIHLTSPTKTEQVADLIFKTYVVPFEVISILLLAALVGAVVIARRD
ncbi:MAG: NADH-quinone oxidoreductase subunit J family protein [Acidimicrobiia bacterium]